MSRILRFLFIIILLLFLAAWIFPMVFKDAIVERVKVEANNNLKAEMTFEDVDLSLISTFPYFGFSLEGLQIKGQGDFEGEPLISVADFQLKVDLMSVIAGESYRIEKISVEGVDLNLIALENGQMNFDILKTDSTSTDSATTSESAPFSLSLQAYNLSKVNFSYDDREADIKFAFSGLEHEGRGDFNEKLVALHTETELQALSFEMEGISYLNRVAAQSNFDLTYDQASGAIQFGENSVRLNELALNFTGGLSMPDEAIDLDLAFSSPQNSLKDLISLIPAYYYQDFDALEAKGNFKLEGFIKGRYLDEKYPTYKLALQVNEGYLHYPEFPTAVESLALDMEINNPSDRLEGTEIQLRKAQASIAGNPIEGRLSLSDPLGDPNLDAAFKGKIDLAKIMEVLPMPGYQLDGKIDADFALATRASYISEERYEKIEAQGGFKVEEISLQGDSIPMPLQIPKGELTLSPQQAKLKPTQMKVAQSDLELQGQFNNMLSYFLFDEPLVGTFNLYSPHLDVANFMDSEESASAEENPNQDTTSLSIIRLPNNVTLDFQANIDELVYDGLVFKKLKGDLRIKESRMEQNLDMNAFGGGIRLGGTYDSKPENPTVDFNMEFLNCEFGAVYEALDMARSLAPFMKNAQGKFYTGLKFKTDLKEDMSPNLKSIKGNGVLNTASVAYRSKVFEQVATFLNNPKYQDLSVKDVSMQFSIDRGLVEVKPFDFKLGGQKAQLGGSMGLDQSLDFDLNTEVPLSALKASSLQSQFASFSSGTIPLILEIGGTVSAPKVKPNLGELSKSVLNEAKAKVKEKLEETKTQAKEAVNEKLAQLVAEAEKQGDVLIAEAESKAAQIKAEAKKQADKVRSAGEEAAQKIMDEAGSNPLKKAAARPLADKARKEAQDKAQALERKAAQEAEQLVEAARKQKQKLIDDAKAKAQL